jgi:hypothetical protein
MASVVDVCNLSLAHLGDEATVSSISPPDGSAQADHCKRFYPIARDALLEEVAWNFATRRIVLAETANTPPDVWAYEYAYPGSCLRILAILDSSGDENAPQDYMQGTDDTGAKVIWTNTEDATALFTFAVTDTTKFSTLFVTTLSYLLASYLAGPITRDPGTKKSMYQAYMAELGKAGVSNAKANKNPATGVAPWISARGVLDSIYEADGRIIR